MLIINYCLLNCHNVEDITSIKMFSICLLTFSAILSTVLVSVNAIHCYQCNSVEDPECNDFGSYRPHLTAGFYKECDDYERYGDKRPFCRKTVVSIIYADNHLRTTRSCGWEKYHLDCYRVDNEDHLETSCQCFEDGCNGSNQVQVFSVVAFLVLSVFVRIL